MINNVDNKKNNLIALGLSLLGFAFLVYYIFRASLDVVASDYIRIINSYLEDVTDLKYLLSWEGISRIPFAFLARYINVTCFKYSVNFDRILGIFGLFIFNFVTVKFVLNSFKSRLVKSILSAVVTLISFSLMSWEMILNGSGFSHFIMVGIIALVFYLFDRISKRAKTIMALENIDSSDKKYNGNKDENNHLSDMVALIDTSQLKIKNSRALLFVYLLTAVGALCFGGSYSVSFLCTIIFFSIIETFTLSNMRNRFFVLIIISIICLLCYFKSNATGEPLIPVGFKDITLLELIQTNPKFPIRFLLKSLASSIIGVETFDYAIAFKTITENMILFVGTIYIVIIFITLYVLVLSTLTRDSSKINIFDLNSYKNIFPLMFVVYGLANYTLVFLARYKFVRDDYGMSSRYGIQYMFLTIGIILILSLYIDNVVYYKEFYIKNKKIHNIITLSLSILSVGILLFGHITTTTDEIYKADYRKIIYTDLVEKAKNYNTLSDEELENAFEYRRNPEHIRSALYTLEKQHLNIFK